MLESGRASLKSVKAIKMSWLNIGSLLIPWSLAQWHASQLPLLKWQNREALAAHETHHPKSAFFQPM